MDQPLLMEEEGNEPIVEGKEESKEEILVDPPNPLSHITTPGLGHQTLTLGCFKLTVRSIPFLIFASDFTISCGAGMTVQFFSLFFANDLMLSPLLVSCVYISTPVLIVIFSSFGLPLSNRFGRAIISVAFDALGTACLVALAFNLPSYVALPLYMVRTAAMNASYPIQRAILMDVVAKQDRGFWNSLENVTAFTWTGSAFLGGLLVDHFDYRMTFGITGLFYLVATCLLSLLIPLTWGEEPNKVKKVDDATIDEKSEVDQETASRELRNQQMTV